LNLFDGSIASFDSSPKKAIDLSMKKRAIAPIHPKKAIALH